MVRVSVLDGRRGEIAPSLDVEEEIFWRFGDVAGSSECERACLETGAAAETTDDVVVSGRVALRVMSSGMMMGSDDDDDDCATCAEEGAGSSMGEKEVVLSRSQKSKRENRYDGCILKLCDR